MRKPIALAVAVLTAAGVALEPGTQQLMAKFVSIFVEHPVRKYVYRSGIAL